MPAAGPATRWEADRSTPARRQYSSTTREPRSSPSRVDRPALAPIRLAALAAVTAPPQEMANSSAKISSPGAGRAGTSPKTISRNIVPNAIRSMTSSPEGLGLGVCPGHVARGAVLGQEFAQRRGDPVALVDGQRAAPAEPAAGSGIDDLGRLAPVGLRPHTERGARVGDRGQQQLGVRVLRPAQYLFGGPGLGNVSRVHDDEPVGHVARTGD